MMKKSLVLMTLAFLGGLGAVSALCVLPVFAGTSSSAGTASPIAAWCESQGGKIEIYQGAQGDTGICRLDRALVGDGTFYSATAGHTRTLATQAFLAHIGVPSSSSGDAVEMPNPASVYCARVGGVSKILRSAPGETGFCEFSDRSLIEEWTLFEGPTAEGNTKLARALGFRSGS